jgi:hypothetical protein
VLVNRIRGRDSIADWPAARDVALRLAVSQVYVHKLIQAGRLRVVQTPLGVLVDPSSIADFEEQRAVRKSTKAVKVA